MNSLPTEIFCFFFCNFSVKFLILFMNCFPDFVYFLCFPAACFLKKAILNYLSAKLPNCMILSLVTGGWLSFSDDRFPWFFMFLGALHCCFHIWSCRLLKSLILVLLWEIVFICPVYTWYVYGYTFSIPYVAEFLSLCVLSGSPQSGYCKPFFFVSWKVVIQLKFIVSPLPKDPGLFSELTACLPEFVFTVSLENTPQELATEWWEVWV